MIKTLTAVCLLAALAAGCRKPPEVETKTDAPAPAAAPVADAAAPAAVPQGRVDASPFNGAALIKKAQGAAATANGAVQQEQKTDTPQQ